MTAAIVLLTAVMAEQSTVAKPVPSPETVRAFAATELPELDALLSRLEKSPPQYQAAIRDLSRQYLRLQKLRERKQTRRYDEELQRWKLDARIQIAAARLAQTQRLDEPGEVNESAERALAAAITAKSSFEQEILRQRKRALEAELKSVRTRLERLEGDSYVANEVKRLRRVAAAASRRDRSRSRPNSTPRPVDESPPAK